MRIHRHLLLTAALLGLAVFVFAQDATQLIGRKPVKDFVVHGNGFMLKGDQAYSLTDGRFRLEGMVVQTRRDTEANLIVEAPLSFYSVTASNIQSGSPLVVRSADGRFDMRGDGYTFQLVSQELLIHSNVVTLFDRSFFERLTATNSVKMSSTNGPLRVTSDNFRFVGTNNDAAYEKNVVLTDGELLTVSAGLLQFNAAALTNTSAQIRASESVQLLMKTPRGPAEAGADRAVFATEPGIDGRVEMTGGPYWKQGGVSGTAGRLSAMFVGNRFEVVGTNGGTMRVPSDFLQTNAPSGLTTNRVQWVDITSDYYRLVPEQLKFGGGVRADQSTNWTMRSETLTALIDPATQQPFEVEALGDFQFQVLLAKGGGIGRADRALFLNSTNQADNRVTLTGEPRWDSTEFQTAADTLVVLDPLGRQEIIAEGNARLSIAAEMIAGLNWFNTNKSEPLPADGGPALIACDRYELDAEKAVFTGNVVVSQSTNSLSAPKLTLWFTPERRAKKLLAENGVAMKNGLKTLTADELTGFFDGPDHSVSEVRADRNVRFTDEEVQAVGDSLVYTGLTQEAVLDGNPVVTAARMNRKTGRLQRVRLDAEFITLNLVDKTVTCSAPFKARTLPEEEPAEDASAPDANLL